MPRAKTKKQLLEQADKFQQEVLECFKGLNEKEHGKKVNNRRLKDHLAHLSDWHNLFLQWYKVGMKNQKPEMPAPGFSWKETPDLNEELFLKSKDIMLSEILKSFKASHKKVMKVIESHSDKELFTKKLYSWTGSTSLGSYLVSCTASHYQWFLKKAKKQY